MKKNNITFPQWLDKIIYDDFNAVYEPRPAEVVYNPDQYFDFVKLYLGTYFPRSYAEAYGITLQILSIEGFLDRFIELEEINVLDFCCGTGGEIIGVIVALQSKLPNLKRVNVDAFDANADAIHFLYHLMSSVNNASEMNVKININPQCIFIESEQEIKDIVSYSNVQYHFMMSFKAINEFVQHKTFKTNAYELVASYLLPLLSQYGVFIMSDVASKLNDGTMFYPQLMNVGLNRFIKETSHFKSIIPTACFIHEENCTGCYMQDIFYVTHSKKSRDISKVAYRVLCKSDFAAELLFDKSSCSCRATNQLADKNSPYKQ
ncbi:MAG: hypothetical protein IKN83_03725 [Bacteroidaceae bacterium]|nr:hypothetical protein [Bacteroidaceae bacterium]